MTGAVDHAHTTGVDVERHHRATGPDPLRDRGGLPARRGRDIGDPLPRLRRQHGHHRLAALVLRRRPTFPDRGEPSLVRFGTREKKPKKGPSGPSGPTGPTGPNGVIPQS